MESAQFSRNSALYGPIWNSASYGPMKLGFIWAYETRLYMSVSVAMFVYQRGT